MEPVKEVKSLKLIDMMKKVINLVIVFLLLTLSVQSQEKIPFWNEVQAFRQKDSVQFPAAGLVSEMRLFSLMISVLVCLE